MFVEESPDWNLDLGGSATCESCNEEPATVHLLRVVNGTVTHTHLCVHCAETVAAQTEGLAVVLAVPSVLWKTPEGKSGDQARAGLLGEQDLRFCSVCGTTLSDVKESGLVGCPHCYKAFSSYLEMVIGQGEQPREHVGKMPRRGSEVDSLKHEIMRLERMLKELVACERFEEAAGVRDRLAELGKRLASDTDL